jgi:hypothetical protein
MTREELIREQLNEVLLNQQPFNKDTEQGVFNKITAPLVALENDLRELMHWSQMPPSQMLIWS